jgi:hypothetical protein
MWERLEARDWGGARAMLADGFVCDYPHTGEQFPSPEAYIAMNRAYPGDWHITVDETVAEGARVAARVRVSLAEDRFHCLAFADVDDGLITHNVEFWLDDRGEAAPDWRAPFRSPQERD